MKIEFYDFVIFFYLNAKEKMKKLFKKWIKKQNNIFEGSGFLIFFKVQDEKKQNLDSSIEKKENKYWNEKAKFRVFFVHYFCVNFFDKDYIINRKKLRYNLAYQ